VVVPNRSRLVGFTHPHTERRERETCGCAAAAGTPHAATTSRHPEGGTGRGISQAAPPIPRRRQVGLEPPSTPKSQISREGVYFFCPNCGGPLWGGRGLRGGGGGGRTGGGIGGSPIGASACNAREHSTAGFVFEAFQKRGERSGSALEQVVVKPSPTFSFSGLLFSRRVFEIWKGGENVTRRGWADGELAIAASRTSHPHTPHTLPLLHNPQGERMHPPSTSLSTSPRVGNRAASRPAVCARAGDYRNSRI
jgi:hypothetical protein